LIRIGEGREPHVPRKPPCDTELLDLAKRLTFDGAGGADEPFRFQDWECDEMTLLSQSLFATAHGLYVATMADPEQEVRFLIDSKAAAYIAYPSDRRTVRGGVAHGDPFSRAYSSLADAEEGLQQERKLELMLAFPLRGLGFGKRVTLEYRWKVGDVVRFDATDSVMRDRRGGSSRNAGSPTSVSSTWATGRIEAMVQSRQRGGLRSSPSARGAPKADCSAGR